MHSYGTGVFCTTALVLLAACSSEGAPPTSVGLVEALGPCEKGCTVLADVRPFLAAPAHSDSAGGLLQIGSFTVEADAAGSAFLQVIGTSEWARSALEREIVVEVNGSRSFVRILELAAGFAYVRFSGKGIAAVRVFIPRDLELSPYAQVSILHRLERS